jgi:alpha-L-arabinofuranosidase
VKNHTRESSRATPCLGGTALAGFIAVAAIGQAASPAVKLRVETGAPGIVVSPTMHGLFFEDINYSADGGLYAELVQNRSFEHNDPLYAWSEANRGGQGHLTIGKERPLNDKNASYLRIEATKPGQGYGVANSGYSGIPVQAGRRYLFAVRARTAGTYRGTLAIDIKAEGRSLGACRIAGIGPDWSEHECVLTPKGTTPRAQLVVLLTTAGQVDLDVVSLFPEDTWKRRRNGLRADLVQALADMKPGFLRFPGGCIVEGKDLPNAYRWKDTIGDIDERRQNWNRWQDAVEIRAPQYHQTHGLGFFEYFQLAEDIGAAPLPVLNCGMACQYQSRQLVPMSEIDPFVQDALDLIEFANGPATSPWGARRAAMGHPAPFGLRFLAIGNEQWGEPYFERYLVFHKVIKAHYPDIEIVSSAGPGVDDANWRLAWHRFRSGVPADLVDEHYYRPPEWFLDNVRRYDLQDRRGPKVFAGEFAAHERDRRSTLRAALAEAAFMTGLLRNADVVRMASYAPLFAREGYTQWKPDLIWFDRARVLATPSLHVQKLFAINRPNVVLPTTLSEESAQAPGPRTQPALFAVAGRDTVKNELILFVVNPAGEAVAADVQLTGAPKLAQAAQVTILTSSSPDDENSFETPDKVSPWTASESLAGHDFTRTFAPNSLTILRLGLAQ